MKRLFPSAFMLVLSCQMANAADVTLDTDEAAHQTAALATGGSAGNPALQTLLSPFLAAVNSDEQTATISGKFDLGGSADVSKYITVTAQTPISQGSDFTNIATLDGLTASSNVEVRLSLFGGGPADSRHFLKDGSKTPAASWVVTFDGKVGSQDHQYFDPTTLLQHTSHTTSWQAGGSAGTIFDSGHASFNVSFDYQEFYQDGDTGESRTQCLTPDNCVTGFIGAPLLMHSGLLSGDLRWIGKVGFDKTKQYPLGAEIKVTYDPIRDAEAVQVPVYFATDDKGSLTGGVRYDWQSDSHVSTIGVFVSTAFSL